MVCCRVGGVVIFWGCFLLGLLILGRDIFWLVLFFVGCCFCGVMVFGGFLVWVVFGCCKVWGWFQFLGLWFFGFGFCSVSVGFCAFDAVGCCFYIGALVGLVVWFFIAFFDFCRVLPVCTVSILQVFIFFAGWYVVRLETSTALIFIFLKALEWIRLFNYCNFIFGTCNSFFDFSLAFTIDFFIF